MAVERLSVYDEIYDFLISAPTPEEIVDFRPSEQAQERMRYLLDTNRNSHLTAEERKELDDYLQLEHFMRGLKIRARVKLAQPQL